MAAVVIVRDSLKILLVAYSSLDNLKTVSEFQEYIICNSYFETQWPGIGLHISKRSGLPSACQHHDAPLFFFFSCFFFFFFSNSFVTYSLANCSSSILLLFTG
jgi:hypothetical protein